MYFYHLVTNDNQMSDEKSINCASAVFTGMEKVLTGLPCLRYQGGGR